MKKIVKHNENGNKLTLEIYVSPKNIAEGIPMSGDSCAIALALGGKKVMPEVTPNELKLDMRNPVSHQRMTYTGFPTKKMRDFIHTFDFAIEDDARRHMRPRKFTIRLTADTKVW